jgi:hypothetical protein
MFVQVSLSQWSDQNSDQICLSMQHNSKYTKEEGKNMLVLIKYGNKMYKNLFCKKWLGKGALGVVLLLHGVNFC